MGKKSHNWTALTSQDSKAERDFRIYKQTEASPDSARRPRRAENASRRKDGRIPEAESLRDAGRSAKSETP